MEDVKKRTPGYAESQIRLLLADLNKSDSSHNIKAVAVKKFADYVSKYKPEIYDDDIDLLFRGNAVDGGAGNGLLYWCGTSSSKHDGQLKRICAPAISLLRTLVLLEFENENIFYERFVHMPLADLVSINFEKHIEPIATKKSTGLGMRGITGGSAMKSNKLVGGSGSRIGGAEDALELLAILAVDHRTPEGESDSIDIEALVNHNTGCLDKVNQYLQRTKHEMVPRAAQSKSADPRAAAIETRPTSWKDVQLRPVPWQEGEDGELEIADAKDDGSPIADPLGVSSADLRNLQTVHENGISEKTRKRQASVYRKRNQSVSMPRERKMSQLLPVEGALSSAEKADIRRNRRAVLKYDDEDDEDEENDEEPAAGAGPKGVQSILPSAKTFSPSLFLSLVHSNITFEQLEHSLQHLNQLLLKQSSQRENLVRQHFGLFINCADDLEWLKAYRLGTHQALEMRRPRKASVSYAATSKRSSVSSPNQSGAAPFSESGEVRLKRAEKSLDRAKSEAQGTLAPILERMRKGRRIRSTEQVLRRLASTLEYPHKMSRALENEDLEEVVAIYKRVHALPVTGSLKILTRVKQNAEAVIGTLKEKCINTLLSPNPNFSTIVRHSKLLQELYPDLNAFLPYLRKSFEVQLKNFRDSVDQLLVRFVDDVDDGQNRLADGETIRGPDGGAPKSSPLMTGVSIAAGLGAAGGGIGLRRGTGSISGSISGMQRRPSTGSKLDEDDNNTQDQNWRRYPAGTDVLEEFLFGKLGASSEGTKTHSMASPGRSRGSLLGREDSGGLTEYVDLDNDADFPVVDSDYTDDDALTAVLMETRFNHLTRLVDCIDSCLPTLHRLISDLTRLAAASNVTAMNARSSIIGVQRDAGLSPARRFCEQLTYCCDRIREAICGVVVTAKAAPASASAAIGATGTKSKESKAVGLEALVSPEALSQPWFASALPEPFYTNALRNVAELYEGITGIIQSRDLMYPGGAAITSNKAAGTAFNPAQREIDQQVKLYIAAISELCELSKENERQQSERILTRVQDASYEMWPSVIQAAETRSLSSPQQNLFNRVRLAVMPVAPASKNKFSKKKDRRLNNLYCSTKAVESILLKSLEKLSARSRRTDWTTSTVRLSVQRVLMSTVDNLRREGLYADADIASRMHTADAVNSRSSNYAQKRLASVSSGGSFAVELDLLDDELKGIVTAAADGRSVQMTKVASLLDVINACVELRTKTFPRIWRAVNTLFPSASEEANSASNSLSPAPGSSASDKPTSVATGISALLKFGFAAAVDHADDAAFHPTSKPSSSTPKPAEKETPPESDLSIESRLERLSGEVVASVNGASMNVMKELAELENSTAERYLSQRMQAYSTCIMNGFASIIQMEKARAPVAIGGSGKRASLSSKSATSFIIGQNNVVSKHFTRLLLMISSDRLALKEAFHRISFDVGALGRPAPGATGNTSSKAQAAGRGRSFGNRLDSEDLDDDDGDDLADFNEISSANIDDPKRTSVSKTLLYQDLLFVELCRGVLCIYAELVSQIMANAFHVLAPAVGAAAATTSLRRNSGTGAIGTTSTVPIDQCQAPMSAALAGEEFRALQALFRLVLPPTIHNYFGRIQLPSNLLPHSGTGSAFASQQQILQDAEIVVCLMSE